MDNGGSDLAARCGKCGMNLKDSPVLNKQNTNSTENSIRNGKFSPFSHFTFYSRTLLIIFICLFIAPHATSLKLTPGGLTSKHSEIQGWSSIISDANPQNPPSSISHLVPDIPQPQSSRRVAKKGRKMRCPKKYRGSFCMNGGICRWIADLKQPSCRCTVHWRGERCIEPSFELSSKGNTKNETNASTILAVVLSISALVFVAMLACICWRKCKTVRKQLKQEDLEMEKQGILMEKQSLDSFSNGHTP